MSRTQILNNVISDLMRIPLPKEGKTVGGSGNFHRDISQAFKLVRHIQWAESIAEMRVAYSIFKKHIDDCVSGKEQQG